MLQWSFGLARHVWSFALAFNEAMLKGKWFGSSVGADTQITKKLVF